MKKLTVLLMIVLGMNHNLSGQKALDFHGEKINDSRIYLLLNGNEIEYFTQSKTEDGKTKIGTNQEFTVKDGNYCNIYIRWLNPLRYRITWKDSIYLDERDKSVKDFVDLLTFQFGSVISEGNKDKSAQDLQNSKQAAILSSTLEVQKDLNQKPNFKETYLTGLEKGFNSMDLTNLFIHLYFNMDSLKDDERKKINELIPILVKLDENNEININKELDEIFMSLFSETDPEEAKNMTDKCRLKIKDYENFLKEDIDDQRKLVSDKLKELKIRNALLNSLTMLSINIFLDEVNTNLINNKKLVIKLNPILEIIDSSISDRSINPETTDYYRIKNISFEPGKKFQTAFVVSEYTYKNETKEFIKEKEITSRKMTFAMYDPVAISVSTGIFYSSTTLKGYGYATGYAGEMTVTEDDITKSNPVTAVFLNFNFGIGSRYFAPLTQIGIDPTKKRPFLLMGTGFSIPSAKIAFSFGPVWTWNQSLNNLSVGQTIASTTALEKDIKYEFDVQPKGWYLGIQYNF
jgi:hypothetical protein